MTKCFPIVLSLSLLIGCSSVKKNNAHLADLIPAEKLQADVSYTQRKLERLHPNLYWYISKKELDRKFDSLKTTITQPMTRLDFYKKISPVVCAVREGHMFVYPPVKEYTEKQYDSIKKVGVAPLQQFDLEYNSGKLIVVANKSYDKSIKPGTEIVAINGESPLAVINEYNRYYTSDGFNTTLKKNFSGTRFSSFYTYKHGLQDALRLELRYKDSLKTATIKRRIADTTGTGKKKNKVLTQAEIAQQKADRKALSKKKSYNGYDELSKRYNRNLRFMEADSSIAVMKIRGFTKGTPGPFYEESFKKIKEHQSKALILDLRDNGGGRLYEIADLYSYLADTTFVFIDESEVVSKTSLLTNTPYFKGGGIVLGVAKAIAAPFFYGYTFFKVRKNGDKYTYAMNSKLRKIKADAFKGKVYVLVNGGSFSASCILSSNLKGSKRAYFVGEETGGTYNGSVAGVMPAIQLPASGIKIRLGLVFIAPHYKTDQHGRGIFPDKEIIPTLQDRIDGRDPEMEWVLNDIKTQTAADTAANK